MILSIVISLALHVPTDTLTLNPSVATAAKDVASAGAVVSKLSSRELTRYGVNNPKDLSSLLPGIHLPTYGASLTSTIYVRGLGSRMENPVMGLYVDDFPILDKNSYDLDYLDIASVNFLHGPQGTAYGRNAMMGVMSVRTEAPEPDRPRQIRAGLEYGTASHIRARLSWKEGRHSFSAGHRHSSGYFRNSFKDAMADPYDGGQLRWRWEKQYSEKLRISNLLQMSISAEGGFAYGLYKDGVRQEADYNDEGSYKRLTLLEGFKVHRQSEKLVLDVMASAQILADHMTMDQDYTPVSIFTLQQKQLSPAQTFEIIARPTRRFKHWRPMSGFFGFLKYNAMAAPVLFKRQGIQSLILDNANAHIPEEIGYLQIPDNEFPIDSYFDILSWNAALYHLSAFPFGDWTFTLGIRLDYEGALMLYDCTAVLDYQLVGMMSAPRPFTDKYQGSAIHGAPVILPKAAVEYRGVPGLRLFASASKGYRAGGFNTQIFSDILQNRMMDGMMADMGVHLDIPTVSVGADKTEYQPEEAWNFEAGLSYAKGGFRASFDAFYMDILRQQLTVFPPGKSTGRMMVNAGRSRSYGTEAQLSYSRGGFGSMLSWGWNDARFTEFNDGLADYAGNRIPYSPAHTLFASAHYEWEHFSLEAHLRGTGPIAWNEANTLEQPFYLTVGARAEARFRKFKLYLQGENLSNTRYNAFYFKSMGNEFFQAGRPLNMHLGIQIVL